MKKLFAVILSLLMLFGVSSALSGCNVGKVYTAEIVWTEPDPNLKIKGMFPKADNNFGNDYTAKQIEKLTGYKIEYCQLSENGDNDVNTLLSQVEPYHFLKVDEAQYHPYLENGTFLDLTELLNRTASGRLLYQLIDLMPYGWDAVSYVDKKGDKHIYGIPDFGYCAMLEGALIWNTDHLRKVGIDKIPETLGEVTTAFEKLQARFGTDSSKKGYHALGVPGQHYSTMVQLEGAFEVPFAFYVDDDGNVQNYIFSDNVTNYAKYINKLRQKDYISSNWQASNPNDAIGKFAQGLFSCVYLQYWYVKPLITTIVGNDVLAKEAGIDNSPDAIRENIIDWSLRIAGDGTDGSIPQEKGRVEGTDASVPYYTVIPAYMAEYATTTIDYLAKKVLAYDVFYGGEEGYHFNEVDAPAGAPAYDPQNKYALYDYEDWDNRILYLRPWEYQYYEYKNVVDESGIITGVQLAKEEPTVVKGGGKWIQLTDKYDSAMDSNSSYATGTNAVSAECLFHIREIGFDAWRICIDMDDTIIRNPMVMSPPLEHWSPISIKARTFAKNGIASAIDRSDAAGVEDSLKRTRDKMWENSNKVQGVRYYYWSNDIIKEMTQWYREVKLGIKS